MIDDINNVLKNLRKIKGFTLRQVEKITGISNSYLSQLENGKTQNPSVNTLYKLSEAYNVDFNSILGLAGVIKNIGYKSYSN